MGGDELAAGDLARLAARRGRAPRPSPRRAANRPARPAPARAWSRAPAGPHGPRRAGRRAGGSHRGSDRARRDCPRGSSRRRARRRPRLPKASKVRSTISIGSASPARARSTASAMPAQTPAADQPGQRRLQPGRRAEMVEQIGVGLADLAPPTAFSVTACGPCSISSRRAASSAAARLSSGTGVRELLTFV